MRTNITPKMKSQVRILATEALERLGHSTLIEQTHIDFRPMIHKIGLSEWNVHRNRETMEHLYVSGFKIILSSSLWPYISYKEKKETVFHECCHLVDAIENKDVHDLHGETWKRYMNKLGLKGNATVNFRQLKIPDDIVFELVQKCSLCGEPGHNARTCKYKTTAEAEALNKAILEQI